MISSTTPHKLAEIIQDTWINPIKSDNKYKHKNSDSLYAHYSMIDDYNCEIFPKLSLAHPIHFKLQKGESLYIPKKWWHWVKTTQRTFAINYWFNNKTEQKPFTFNHTIDYDINLLNSEMVSVWKSEKNYGYAYEDRSYETNFDQFYNSGDDNLCVLTLSNYYAGEYNTHIKNKLFDYVKFPVNEKLLCDYSYDYNVWITSNKHDTGLHYDDEDGILTVIEGEKDVILFPPSDTEYLYPYQVDYKWKKLPALNFGYNICVNFGEITGVCSGELLYITCNDNVRVLSNISKLYDKYRNTNLIWGFKKNGDEYRWEIYNYTLNDKIKITSWDIHSNTYEISDEEHYYFKLGDESITELPFWGYGKYKKNDVIYDESKIFVIDLYESFCKNYDEYMDRLDYELIKTKFKKIILEKYKCSEICIHNKNPNQIFVQYLGITNQEFIEFLTLNQYPEYIINFVIEQVELNNYKITNEITIVYDMDTQDILRSGFYGNL
jgi:hypothetical protein